MKRNVTISVEGEGTCGDFVVSVRQPNADWLTRLRGVGGGRGE